MTYENLSAPSPPADARAPDELALAQGPTAADIAASESGSACDVSLAASLAQIGGEYRPSFAGWPDNQAFAERGQPRTEES